MKTSVISVKFLNPVFYSLFVSYQPIYLTKSASNESSSFINRLTYNAFHCYKLEVDNIFLGIRDVDYSIYPVILLMKFL